PAPTLFPYTTLFRSPHFAAQLLQQPHRLGGDEVLGEIDVQICGIVREALRTLGVGVEPLAQGSVELEVVGFELGPGVGGGRVEGCIGRGGSSHTAIEHRRSGGWVVLPGVPARRDRWLKTVRDRSVTARWTVVDRAGCTLGRDRPAVARSTLTSPYRSSHGHLAPINDAWYCRRWRCRPDPRRLRLRRRRERRWWRRRWRGRQRRADLREHHRAREPADPDRHR